MKRTGFKHVQNEPPETFWEPFREHGSDILKLNVQRPPRMLKMSLQGHSRKRFGEQGPEMIPNRYYYLEVSTSGEAILCLSYVTIKRVSARMNFQSAEASCLTPHSWQRLQTAATVNKTTNINDYQPWAKATKQCPTSAISGH